MTAAAPAIWTPPDGVRVVAARHAFRTDTVTLEMPEGPTLAAMVEAAGVVGGRARVWIDDWEIPRAHWARVRPKQGRQVLIRAVAGGGGGGQGGSNKTLRTLLLLVVVIASLAVAYFAPYVLPAMIGPLTAAQVGSIAAAAVMIGGSLAVNALLPPPKPKFSDLNAATRGSPTYQISGSRNQLSPYQTVPRVYGRHRMFPC